MHPILIRFNVETPVETHEVHEKHETRSLFFRLFRVLNPVTFFALPIPQDEL